MAKHSFDLPLLDEERDLATRAVVLKAIFPDDPSLVSAATDPTEEIVALADTAGVEVLAVVTQRRRRPHAATYVGKGKIQELGETLAHTQSSLILIDDPLSPSQGRNIEEATGCRVIDRTELIMDIFATHARSHQAKLQVELAQLRYSQSRLRRMWTHLSRFEGGIGMRGPGETQLETDRRIIGQKIALLKTKLKEIEKQHATQSKARTDAFRVALVGYTNAGKSTLMRRLTGAPVLVEDRLFSTLDTSTRKWDLPCQRDVIVSDTVGFIRKLPLGLVASFHATLMEAEEADLLLHVVDGTSSHVEADIGAVEDTLELIHCDAKQTLLLFNKVECLPEERLIDLRYFLGRYPDSLAISAADGRGIAEPGGLTPRVLKLATSADAVNEYRLPASRGDLLAHLRRVATVLEERYDNEGVIVSARLSDVEAERFKALLARNGLWSTRGR